MSKIERVIKITKDSGLGCAEKHTGAVLSTPEPILLGKSKHKF